MGEEKANKDGSFWSEHLASWKASGLTKLGYCEQVGIDFRRFLYQQRRFGVKAKKSTRHFVEANSVISGGGSKGCAIQVCLPNGVRIGIGSEADEVLLGQVLELVWGLGC